jgi:hypothetical protein
VDGGRDAWADGALAKEIKKIEDFLIFIAAIRDNRLSNLQGLFFTNGDIGVLL